MGGGVEEKGTEIYVSQMPRSAVGFTRTYFGVENNISLIFLSFSGQGLREWVGDQILI